VFILVTVYFAAVAVFPCCAFRTLATIFSSSTRKARIMRFRMHGPHRDPPYARDTVLCRLDMARSCRGRPYVSPLSFNLQSPHLATTPAFFVYKYTSRPPGVLELIHKVIISMDIITHLLTGYSHLSGIGFGVVRQTSSVCQSLHSHC
jgi:hypothetical protein